MARTQILSAAGPSMPVTIETPPAAASSTVPKLICCAVAGGSSLTYAIVVSPDGQEPRRWAPLDDLSTGLTASRVRRVALQARAVRANVTGLTRGSLAFDVY